MLNTCWMFCPCPRVFSQHAWDTYIGRHPEGIFIQYLSSWLPPRQRITDCTQSSIQMSELLSLPLSWATISVSTQSTRWQGLEDRYTSKPRVKSPYSLFTTVIVKQLIPSQTGPLHHFLAEYHGLKVGGHSGDRLCKVEKINSFLHSKAFLV